MELKRRLWLFLTMNDEPVIVDSDTKDLSEAYDMAVNIVTERYSGELEGNFVEQALETLTFFTYVSY